MSLQHWENYYRGGALATCPLGVASGYTQELRDTWVEFFSGLPEGARILDISTGNGAVALIALDTAAIEADIDWREPELECTGMPRPDGRGLRLRFSGPLPGGGELAIVFAAPELGIGISARSVPVNVKLLDEAGEQIYGTQGDSRCLFDEVEQLALAERSLPPRSFSVSARGFCTVPARAVDGDGFVLLTRFDFAGLVTFQQHDGAAPDPVPPPQ